MKGKQHVELPVSSTPFLDADSHLSKTSGLRLELRPNAERCLVSFFQGLVDGLKTIMGSTLDPVPAYDVAWLHLVFVFGSVVAATSFGTVLGLLSAYSGCLVSEHLTSHSFVDAAPDSCKISSYAGVFIGIAVTLGVVIRRLFYPKQTTDSEVYHETNKVIEPLKEEV